MIFNIHVETIILLIAMGHVFSGMLGGFYLIMRKSDTALHIFLWSRLFDTAAWALLWLNGQVPDWLSVLGGHSVLIVGNSLQIMVFLSSRDYLTSRRKWSYCCGTLVSIFMFQLVTILFQNPNGCIAMACFSIAVCWLFPLYLSARDKNASLLQRIVTVVQGAGVCLLLFRTFCALFLDPSAVLAPSHICNIVFFLCLYPVIFIGNIGLIFLAREKSDLLLTKAASYDELTDLYNRRAFFKHARECLALCVRQQTPISFFIMDLDHFKNINDFYGHLTGDMVLKNFSATIKRQLRGYDIFGRIGGEEFCALLPGVGEEEAFGIAQRLRNSVEENIINYTVKYTVSIGLATVIPDESTTIEHLYRLGDDALYQAKKSGRNQIGVANTKI